MFNADKRQLLPSLYKQMHATQVKKSLSKEVKDRKAKTIEKAKVYINNLYVI